MCLYWTRRFFLLVFFPLSPISFPPFSGWFLRGGFFVPRWSCCARRRAWHVRKYAAELKLFVAFESVPRMIGEWWWWCDGELCVSHTVIFIHMREVCVGPYFHLSPAPGRNHVLDIVPLYAHNTRIHGNRATRVTKRGSCPLAIWVFISFFWMCVMMMMKYTQGIGWFAIYFTAQPGRALVFGSIDANMRLAWTLWRFAAN